MTTFCCSLTFLTEHSFDLQKQERKKERICLVVEVFNYFPQMPKIGVRKVKNGRLSSIGFLSKTISTQNIPKSIVPYLIL